MKRLLLSAMLLAVVSSLSAKPNVVYFNNIARPLGMGGAFTAVEDADHNHLYNPAASVFSETNKTSLSWSFDVIRGAYLFIKFLDSWKEDSSELTEDDYRNAAILAAFLSTSQILIGNHAFQVKWNVMDQLITPGQEFPMYVSSFTASLRFEGMLQGFQAGATVHLYNPIGTKDPSGEGFSIGLFYRPPGNSPFSIGAFFFKAPETLMGIRKPFERMIDDTFNLGATYEVADRFTLAADLRNVSKFGESNYFQPHFGLEKVFVFGKTVETSRLALRGGTFYNSETKEVGYSAGFEFRIRSFGPAQALAKGRYLRKGGEFFFSYSWTQEKNPVTARDNHIFSIGLEL